MSAPAPSSRSRFAEVATRSEEEFDLALAALLVAAEEYPQLPAEIYLARLDAMAERARDRLGQESASLLVLQEVGHVIHELNGLRGNVENFYDPRNSFLNDVLDRRLGIPITLSIVWLEVGWRLGLPLEGVNFPGHFLVRYRGEAMPVLVDPYHGGQIRFEDEAASLFGQAFGPQAAYDPGYLRPASRKDIIVRLLSNLKLIYTNQRDEARALSALDRILLIRPDSHDDLRDRGMLLARTGRSAEAVADLALYLQRVPDASDATRIRMLIDALEQE